MSGLNKLPAMCLAGTRIDTASVTAAATLTAALAGDSSRLSVTLGFAPTQALSATDRVSLMGRGNGHSVPLAAITYGNPVATVSIETAGFVLLDALSVQSDSGNLAVYLLSLSRTHPAT